MLGRREGCIAHAQERAGFSRLMRARGGEGGWRVPACLWRLKTERADGRYPPSARLCRDCEARER